MSLHCLQCEFHPDGMERCENFGRYLNAQGRLYCGIHDNMAGVASIRLTDLPRMIAKITLIMRTDPTMGDGTLEQLKELVCHSGA